MKKYEYVVTKKCTNSAYIGYESVDDFMEDANRLGAQGFRFVCRMQVRSGWGGGGFLFEREIDDVTNEPVASTNNTNTELSLL